MRTTSQRGQVYPLFALMLTSLIGVSALSVDVGYYRYQQRLQQTAADSAALAGAQASAYDGTNSSNYLNAARADAQNNGFTNGTGNVTVDAIPVTDSYTGSDGGIKATITKAYPKFFGAIFGGGSRSISTVAVARLEAVSGACLTTLNDKSTSLSTINGGSIAASQCSIANNGCTSVTGGTGGKVDVQSWLVNASSKSCSSWNPNGDSQYQYSLPVVDPCSLTPQCKTLAQATASSLGLSSDFKTCTSPATASGATLNGGCYNNLKFNANQTWTLNPGIYVLTGNVQFSKGTVNGPGGVTIYLAKGATYTDSSNMTLNITAPTGDGDFSAYADGENGMAFFQAPASAYSVTMAANVNIIGMSYLPDWDVTFNGHTQGFTGSLIVDTATVKGAGKGSQLTLNPGTGDLSAGAKIPVLVE
jgi:putative Flp pilus-assembly TadE/G-like protein